MSRIDIEQILEDYDRAWQRGPQPALAKYLLPEGHPERGELVIALVHIDLEYRLKAGDEAPLVETYLRLYPEAFSDATEAARLIAAEYQQRWRREPGVRRDDYLLRFPEYAGELPGRLRPRWDCPSCRKPLEIADEAAESVTCCHCQSLCPIRRQPITSETVLTTRPAEPATVRRDWPSIPGYEILNTLGHGGMGIVFQARKLNLQDRLVALKMVLAGPQARPEDLARFFTEAEAVARLEHANVVRIYELGEHQGQPYIALEFAGGGSLDKKLAGQPQPPREAATLVETLARAMQAVHERGILHRDLKPANVLLTSDNTPKISDFGLAKRLQEGSGGLTPTAAVLGTPEYMAPEQAAGQNREIGPAADIYALGAILYEMLTGHPPLRGVTWMDTLQLVLHAEPIPPRHLQPKVQRDLETICLKCLRKDPARRYASAQELADDLRRFLNGEPIHARPVRLVERGVKWVRRHSAVTALIVMALLMTLGVLGWLWQAHNLDVERRQRAIDHAIAAAMSGNLESADQAIREAELQGASTGEVHFLRGLVYFHKSDVKPAIEHLEQAARLLPDSVAVRALLAIFYERAGLWDMRDKWMTEVYAMEARTPEDWLFRGYEQSLLDPKGALPTLDQAVARRDRPIARAIRAEVRARYALEWSKLAMAVDAQTDARAALPYLPNNPFALAASAQAHFAAAILFEESDDTNNRGKALEEMKANILALESPAYPWAGLYRWLYYVETGQEDLAREALRTAARGSEKADAIAEYATELYRRGQIDEALAALEQQHKEPNYHGDFLNVCLLVEGKDGLAGAAKAFADWQDRYAATDVVLNGAVLLLLRGCKQEAKVYAAKKREFDPRSSPLGKEAFHEGLRAYASGENPSPTELLKTAGEIRSWQTRAHFLIAMTYLADGKRGQAADHFQEAVKRRSYLIIQYWMSRAMLARIKNDPAWPSWRHGT